MGEKYNKLIQRLTDIQNLDSTLGVLNWDQETQMPPGGATARGSQMATISRIRHEMFTDDATQRLLEDAAAELNGADYDSDEASVIRVVGEDLEEATKVPAQHVGELAQLTTLAHHTWAKARQTNDFRLFQADLEKIVELTVKTAEYLGYDENPYDALVNQFERGITAAEIARIFAEHKPQLIELIAAISEVTDRVDDSVLHQPYDLDKQREFATWVIKKYGFDFDRGRLDEAVHPFQTNFSVNDVRITTRFSPDFFNPALFGMMHETGHGLYEMGVREELEGTLLSQGTSLGVHESQSRMWENLVGRSEGFWSWALPKLKETFPDQLGDVNLRAFYKAINKVEPSYVRVEADEATYNLHIMLRFELENDMINGRVRVADLPREWNERFEAFLGLIPPTNALGVLQDIHWSMGGIGYFATYALGNLLSAQYYNTALKAHPQITDEIASGKFDTLLGWLRENIHQHGRKFTSDELTRRITGQSITSKPYIAYLQNKFSDIYDL
jgi:carboxypeptidase Taq